MIRQADVGIAFRQHLQSQVLFCFVPVPSLAVWHVLFLIVAIFNLSLSTALPLQLRTQLHLKLVQREEVRLRRVVQMFYYCFG